jgi:hypothetical protein
MAQSVIATVALSEMARPPPLLPAVFDEMMQEVIITAVSWKVIKRPPPWWALAVFKVIVQ